MHSPSEDHAGARIARLRRAQHLTQREFSDLSAIPYSTLTKTEQGKLPATPHLIGAAARALRVEVSSVTGQPYESDLRADELDVLISPVRRALDVFDLGADPDIRARRPDVLREEAERLCAAVRAGDIKKAAAEVAGLIEEATTAAHTASTGEGWLNLASLYRTSYDVAAKLGYADLAQLSLARLDWAAQRASDPVLGGICHYFRALTYLRQGNYRTGRRLVEAGLSTLAQADPTREREVVTGQIHLGAAVMSGRAHDADAANDHLDAADRIGQETGEAVKVHWLAFGPTNVAVHRVSVLAELDAYGEAVETADTIQIPDDWPKSRTSHHYAEVARAQLWTGQHDPAFASLQRARRAAPQQAKHHPTVRETYAGLEAAHRRRPTSFLSYGSWLNSRP